MVNDKQHFLKLIIFIFSFILYGNTISHNYTYDDVTFITQNKFTQQGFKGIPEILTTSYRYGWNNKNEAQYRPLSIVTFAIENQFWNNPHISHFINVLLYSITGIIIFATLLLLFKNYNVIFPFTVTMFFVAHPIHTEVVASIKCRDEILAFIGSVSALYFVFRYLQNSRFIFLIIAMACFFFALLSKENAITFLVVIPLTVYFFTSSSHKKIFSITVFLGMVTIIYLLILYYFSLKAEKGPEIHILDNSLIAVSTIGERIGTNFFLLLKYMSLLVFPHPLIHDYSFNQFPILNITNFKAIAGMVLSVSLLVFAFIKFFKKNVIAYCIFYFFITLSVVSNIFILINCALAERFLFTPSLSYCIILCLLITRITKPDLKNKMLKLSHYKIFIFLTSLILVLYSFKTINRNTDWKNNLSLFKADIKKTPDNARVHYSLGSEFMFEADNELNKKQKLNLYNEAMRHLKKSIQILPVFSAAHYNMGNVYAKTKKFKEAISSYNNALMLDSAFVSAYINLGNSYNELLDFDKAIAAFNKANTLDSENPSIFDNLGNSYFKKGNIEDAIMFYQKAIKSDEKFENAYFNLSYLFYHEQRFDEAITVLKKLISITPRSYIAYHRLGLVYQSKGDTAMAKQCFDISQKNK